MRTIQLAAIVILLQGPLFHLLNGGLIEHGPPVQFWAQWISLTAYGLLYLVLCRLGHSPLITKRLASAMAGVPLGLSACYALLSDSDEEMARRGQLAMGLLQGVYGGDMICIVPQQSRIGSLVLHHIGIMFYWQLTFYRPQVRTVFLMGQATELVNVSWYAFWIASGWLMHLDARRWVRFLFFANAAFLWLSYLVFRLCWVQGAFIRAFVTDVFSGWPVDLAFFFVVGVPIFAWISVSNLIKLTKAIQGCLRLSFCHHNDWDSCVSTLNPLYCQENDKK